MILILTELSDEPLHAQISRQIRAKILCEGLEGGAPLPSIRGLAREQRVSVITVQRAYDDLEREGLLHSRRGKGFWVAPISETRRRTMAEERFSEATRVVAEQGAADGLSDDAMRRILDEILKKGGRH